MILAALLINATLLGQSASLVTRVQTFHVQGTIRDYRGAVRGIEVTFEGRGISKTVSSDE
jgi:hypothetical protein